MGKEIRETPKDLRDLQPRVPFGIPQGVKRQVPQRAAEFFKKKRKEDPDLRRRTLLSYFKDKGQALLAAIGQMVNKEARNLPPQVRSRKGASGQIPGSSDAIGTEEELAESLFKTSSQGSEKSSAHTLIFPPVPKGAKPTLPPQEIQELVREITQQFSEHTRGLSLQDLALPLKMPIREGIELHFSPTQNSIPIQVQTPRDQPPSLETRKLLVSLQNWFDQEVPRIADHLQKEWDYSPPPELALAISQLREYPDLNIWLNLAILYFLAPDEWELRGVQFDAQRLVELILLELRHYYQKRDFSHQSPPEKVLVLEDTVECRFKVPAAPTGLPLSFDAIEKRDQRERAYQIKLRPKDRGSNLAEPLQEAEGLLNGLIDAKTEELKRRFPEQDPAKALTDFPTYSWEDVATYAIIKGKDPGK